MSDEESKEVNPRPAGFPQAEGFGEPQDVPPKKRKLKADIIRRLPHFCAPDDYLRTFRSLIPVIPVQRGRLRMHFRVKPHLL